MGDLETSNPRRQGYEGALSSQAASQDGEGERSSTWGSFAEVVAAYTEGKGDGIGFVITADDPYCGIDLDSCVDPLTGEIDPWALEIIEVLDGYTELSPSRTGLHIIVQAKLPEGGRRKGSIEFYDRDRFFTMTGWVVHA